MRREVKRPAKRRKAGWDLPGSRRRVRNWYELNKIMAQLCVWVCTIMHVYTWRGQHVMNEKHREFINVSTCTVNVCYTSVCVCVHWRGEEREQLKHFDIPVSVSSGVKSVGGSNQTHAVSLQALTLLFSIHLSPLLLPFQFPSFYPLFATSVSVYLPCFFLFISSGLSSHSVFTTSFLFTCRWWMLMNLWIFAWGGLFWGIAKMISQPAVWNMGSWRNRVGAERIRQLFCSGPFYSTEGVAHLK